MINKRVSNRYANALFQLAVEQGKLDDVVSDFVLIDNAIRDSQELRHFLSTPIIGELVKARILTEIFASKVSQLMSEFIALLARKGRSGDLPGIVESFVRLMHVHNGEVPAEITIATGLDTDIQASIVNRLEKISGRKVVPTFRVDSSLIGGFRARFEDTMLDASVRNQLERLHASLVDGVA